MDKKIEAKGALPKKGQIITNMHLQYTLSDTPFAKYLEDFLLPALHPNILLNFQMDPAELQDRYAAIWDPSKPVTGNDCTGWDTGIEREFYEFDMWLMRLLHFPQWYMDMHTHRRFNAYTHIGRLPMMQASGDRYTWVLNTLRNVALMSWLFEIPTGTPMAFSGDDSLICGHFPITKHYHPSEWRMSFKPFWGRTGPFCGWTFGGTDLYIHGAALLHRARIFLQRGIASADSWRSIRDAVNFLNPDSRSLPAISHCLRIAGLLYHLPPY